MSNIKNQMLSLSKDEEDPRKIAETYHLWIREQQGFTGTKEFDRKCTCEKDGFKVNLHKDWCRAYKPM